MRSLALCMGLFCGTALNAQPLRPGTAAPSPAQPEAPADIFGRTTPRGTVLGFLKAARKGDYEAAARYLNTRASAKAASELAHQLFVVLDRRLPARLNELSDRPEGSLVFLTRPDEDLVGTIDSDKGKVDIIVERVAADKTNQVWLFSRKTLEAVPELYNEVNEVSVDKILPGLLVHTQIAHIALFEWIAVFVGLPLLYLIFSLLNKTVSSWAGHLRRRVRRSSSLPDPTVLPQPVRLLAMVVFIRWTLSRITLPLLERQFWSGTLAVLSVIALVWLFVLLNGWGEDFLGRRLRRLYSSGATSILRLGRGTLDILVAFIGALVLLRYFGVNITAALAGLGVGGIAVALAAQKTLENVIGGISIILDHAVRVGDMLNIGNTMGTVENVGLRSTRLRTLDRTLVIVPNGQLANVQVENLSAREKFWFHPLIRLRYETTASVLRSVVGKIKSALEQQVAVDSTTVRVCLLQFGASSFDIDVFAYFSARDYRDSLETQQELLLQVMEIVEAAGARIALQSHTVYLADARDTDGAAPLPGNSDNPA